MPCGHSVMLATHTLTSQVDSGPAMPCANSMGEWILPTLFQVLSQEGAIVSLRPADRSARSAAAQQLRADRQWAAAIVALENWLQPMASRGICLSGPLPVLSQPDLLKQFQSWTFTTAYDALSLQLPFQLTSTLRVRHHSRTLPLFPQDPLAAEQFCLVLTPQFSLILLLSQDEQHEPCFAYSFVPEVIDRVWQLLRLRVVMMRPQQLEQLDQAIAQFPAVAPDYKLVTQFSQMLLNSIADVPVAVARPLSAQSPQDLAAAVAAVAQRQAADAVAAAMADAALPHAALPNEPAAPSLDVELLQAIAHEIRTPLTTIRMLTRLLMKRPDMAADALKRLESIDRECSEQIDRFGFIFRAVEMETSESQGSQGMALTATCLAQIFAQSMPRWQQQASQRGLVLDVILPAQMPSVVTDPALLDQALSSLIDRSARSLPAGSTIQVEAAIAGHQLKLQVQSNLADSSHAHKPLIKSLGQMLMFQPETGNLSLNLAVTKNLFRAMGGRMTVRQRSTDDEVFTIFLPIEPSKPR
jgi:signal transduction histidine kinase